MFGRYGEGIWTTDDSWFEATHESVAKYRITVICQNDC